MERVATLVVAFFLILHVASARVLGLDHTLGLLHGKVPAGSDFAASTAAVQLQTRARGVVNC